jgi:hypothetical protein
MIFLAAPRDIATALWYTGLDPFAKKPVTVARGMRDRKMQRALMQFSKPENWFTVREALLETGRGDLIGNGCDCLIPSNAPKKAMEKRRRDAQRAVEGDHYHTVANPARGAKPGDRGAGPVKPTGYRPGRKTQQRRQEKRKGKSGPKP